MKKKKLNREALLKIQTRDNECFSHENAKPLPTSTDKQASTLLEDRMFQLLKSY